LFSYEKYCPSEESRIGTLYEEITNVRLQSFNIDTNSFNLNGYDVKELTSYNKYSLCNAIKLKIHPFRQRSSTP